MENETDVSGNRISSLSIKRHVKSKQSIANYNTDAGSSKSTKGMHKLSYFEALIHLLKGNLGSGLFAMGDAVRNSGIVLGPIILVLLGILCTHCEHILLNAAIKMNTIVEKESMDEVAEDIEIHLDFAETVEECFKHGHSNLQKMAKFMKMLTNTFLCITQLGFCCVYIIFVADNYRHVADAYNYKLDIHIHMAIIFPLILTTILIRNLKYLAPLSAIANVCLCVGLVITLVFVCQQLPDIRKRAYVGAAHKLPLFFGTSLFAFEGIGLVLPVRNEMKNPSLFKKPFGVLNVGMFLNSFLLTTLGFFSYWKFGEEIKSSVTLNLPEDEWLSITVQIIIGTCLLLTYSLQFYIPLTAMLPIFQQITFCKMPPTLLEFCVRIGLCIITFLMAELVPYLNHFISLVGAMSSTTLALIIPPVLEFVIAEKISAPMIVKNVMILCVGFVGFVTGTFYSFKNINQAFDWDKKIV